MEMKPAQFSILCEFVHRRPGATCHRALLIEQFSFCILRQTASISVCLQSAALYSTDMPTEDDIRNALKSVKYPGYSRDIVSFGLVKHIAIHEGAAHIILALTSANAEAARQLKTE